MLINTLSGLTMWYGFKQAPNISRLLKNQAYRLNVNDRRFGKPLPRYSMYPSTSFRFQVPGGWDFVLLAPKGATATRTVVYAYNSTYFLNFVLRDESPVLRYDYQTRTLQFKSFLTSYNYLWYLKTLSSLFSKFHKPFFLKLKFKGKGYYVYKNARNTIAPQFGYAHRVYVYSFKSSVKFLSKTKVLLFGLSKVDIMRTGHAFMKTRPINVFTGRGVRFAKQIIYRKTGKVGAYR